MHGQILLTQPKVFHRFGVSEVLVGDREDLVFALGLIMLYGKICRCEHGTITLYMTTHAVRLCRTRVALWQDLVQWESAIFA